MYTDPHVKYVVQEWDGTLEVVRAIHHPDDAPNTLRVLYPDGWCLSTNVRYFEDKMGAMPVLIH